MPSRRRNNVQKGIWTGLPREVWTDHSRAYRGIRHRDRDIIAEQLSADEDPIPAPLPRPKPPARPAPFSRNNARPPQPEIPGWEFVEKMELGGERQLPHNIPNDLVQLWHELDYVYDYDSKSGHMRLATSGKLLIRPHQTATFDDWNIYALHLLLHLVHGHVAVPEACEEPGIWKLACEMVVNQHIIALNSRTPLPSGFINIGPAPSPFARFGNRFRNSIPTVAEQYQKLCDNGLPKGAKEWMSPAGKAQWDVVNDAPGMAQRFRRIYQLNRFRKLEPKRNRYHKYYNSPAATAFNWFLHHFPLLGSASAQFSIDYESAQSLEIAVAAVDAVNHVIFLNLETNLTELEWRFVIGHEILHVVLEHHQRLGEKDAFIWNLACDYVINNWLVQMGVGVRPPKGGLYNEKYKGWDAETVYQDLVENGGNEQMKLTFRGQGKGDMLDLDKVYAHKRNQERNGRRFRPNVRQMAQESAKRMMEDKENGLNRGELPGDLIEELDLASLMNEEVEVPEWKAELAEWFNVKFAPKPPRRSYNRPSRRQASSPDIPRPGLANLDFHSPTFGVVLDTSGSMSSELLQKGLAALVAFSELHGISEVRMVMCDTRPFDEGFIKVEKLRRPYQIWGRGGTILQPAVELLQDVEDFPADAPILIITDGAIDQLTIEREHAFLLPGGGDLPFEPQGPVFRILGDNNGRGGLRRQRPTRQQNQQVNDLIDRIKQL